MAQIEQSDKGKKKKGAQKKKQIHVDFTPMVDMNMLLITFFMLCTTMIKPQTLSIALPSNEKNQNPEVGTKAAESNAITMILDTEYDDSGHVVMEDGKPVHKIYWYAGKALSAYDKDFKSDDQGNAVKVNFDVETVDADQDGIMDAEYAQVFTGNYPFEYRGQSFVSGPKVHAERYIGNSNGNLNGIRSILRERNKDVYHQIDSLKGLYKANAFSSDKDENKRIFDEKAAQIRGAKLDTLNANHPQYDYTWVKRPVIIIKPGPNATFENVVNALDEMQINQIAQYQINTIDAADSLLIQSFKHYTGAK